jgi:ubiquinone/menaquinone biosynthesis C-methylase UbiE
VAENLSKPKEPKNLRLGEFLLAVEGLALARNLFQGSEALADQRIAGIRETLGAMAHGDSIENQTVSTEELSLLEGYALWSAGYDEISNPLIDVEQPALLEVLKTFRPGTATDVCCGTGRVSVALRKLGHSVTGIDQSAPMLDVARAKDPSIAFLERSLGGSPPQRPELPQNQDLVTCSLALTHFADLGPPLRDISNMLRAGGTAVLTDLHPMVTAFDGQGFFNADDGRTRWVRNYFHQFSDYLRAFASVGLRVNHCEEIVPADGDGPMQSLAGILRPEATRQAYFGLPSVLLWVVQKPIRSASS